MTDEGLPNGTVMYSLFKRQKQVRYARVYRRRGAAAASLVPRSRRSVPPWRPARAARCPPSPVPEPLLHRPCTLSWHCTHCSTDHKYASDRDRSHARLHWWLNSVGCAICRWLALHTQRREQTRMTPVAGDGCPRRRATTWRCGGHGRPSHRAAQCAAVAAATVSVARWARVPPQLSWHGSSSGSRDDCTLIK